MRAGADPFQKQFSLATAQSIGKRAGFAELRIVIIGIRAMSARLRDPKCRLDLGESGLRLRGVIGAPRKDHHRSALIAGAPRPVERNPIARQFLQRRAIGRDRLLEPRRPAFPLAERQERTAEIVLSRRPSERDPVARQFLQRRAKGRDRLLEPRRPALPLAASIPPKSCSNLVGSSRGRSSDSVRR